MGAEQMREAVVEVVNEGLNDLYVPDEYSMQVRLNGDVVGRAYGDTEDEALHRASIFAAALRTPTEGAQHG